MTCVCKKIFNQKAAALIVKHKIDCAERIHAFSHEETSLGEHPQCGMCLPFFQELADEFSSNPNARIDLSRPRDMGEIWSRQTEALAARYAADEAHTPPDKYPEYKRRVRERAAHLAPKAA